MIVFSIIVVALLLGCASLISALETSVIASSPGRIQKKRSISNGKVELLLRILKNKDKVISTLLIIYSILNTVATTIATGVILELVDPEYSTIVASAIMSILVIVFAEVLPKAIAVSKAEKIAMGGAKFINHALWLMRPINFALHKIVKLFCFIFKIDLKSDISAAEEVRGVIEHYHQEGNVIKNDRDMLGGVLDLRHITVAEIMVHRSQMIIIDADLPVADIVNQALKTPYTRIPLWQGSKDNIIGILHLRNLLKALHKNKFEYTKVDIKLYISEPWFVPENALLSRQLMEFRTKRSHIAIVVDEYGDIIGILTLEDILEEIVGQIDDEHDVETNKIVKKDKNIYIVEGTTTVRDLNRELNIILSDEQAHTIAGVIMHHLERLPNVGDKLELNNVRMTIIKKQTHKIKQVLIERLDKNRHDS